VTYTLHIYYNECKRKCGQKEGYAYIKAFKKNGLSERSCFYGNFGVSVRLFFRVQMPLLRQPAFSFSELEFVFGLYSLGPYDICKVEACNTEIEIRPCSVVSFLAALFPQCALYTDRSFSPAAQIVNVYMV
jgi:hypothetical protein